MKINIGCGLLPLTGYKNIDKSKEAHADEFYDPVHDGIQEEDNSCEEVNAGCMIEQINHNDLFINFFNEVWRVLEKGGKFTGYVPSTDPRVIFLDPMDRRFFQTGTFNYFVKGERSFEQFGKVYGFKPWESCMLAEVNDNGILHFCLVK